MAGSNPIFGLSRTDYYHQRSYADYFRLIELSGYEWCYFDEMCVEDPTKCYIISPYDPEWGGFPNAKARIIWWDLEWRFEYPDVPGIWAIWISDMAHAKRVYQKRVNINYVPFGSHKDLKLDIGEVGGKKYDVCMLSYMTNRRQYLVDRLKEWDITISPQGWDAERHAALCQSSAMLHVHQHDDLRTVAPQRFALAAAYSLPLISETIDDRGVFAYSDFLVSDYANLPQFVSMWTKRNESRILEDFGRALHQKLCVENTFKSFVEAAL